MAYSIAKSIFRNTALMMTAQMITWVSGLVLLLFLPRFLGSGGYGRLYLAMSIQLICQWLIDYGGANYVSKEVSRNRSDAAAVSEIVTDSAVIRIGLWFLSLLLTLALCFAAKYSFTVIVLVMVLGLSNLWTNMTTLLRECYLGFEAMKYPSIASVVERSFLMIAVVPALLLGARATVVVILMAVSTTFSCAITWKYSKTLFRLSRTIRFDRLKKMVMDGLPYFLWSLFGVIYYRIDSVLLSVMAPDSVIGWYGAAYKFFDILMFLPAIFSQALYPVLTRLGASQFDSLKDTSRKSLRDLLLAAFPIMCAIIFFAGSIIRILFGLAEFSHSIIDLQIFAVGIPIFYADFVLGNIVLALDKQKKWALGAFIAMLVNIGSNLILIKYFQSAYGNGGIGSAIATGLTEVFVMAYAVSLLPKGFFSKHLFVSTIKGIMSVLVMGLSIIGMDKLGIPWIVEAGAGTVFYALTLILLGTFEQWELELISKAFSIKRLKEVMTTGRG